MERLTEKFKDGRNILRKGITDIFYVGFGRFFEGEAVDKLAEYEDLEEQGKLLKLPCAVGDTVYVILPHDSYITEAQINKIEVKPTVYGKMCCFVEPVAHRGRLYRYFENDFGKTVFLVIDEAVQKMGEIRGKGGGTQ